MAMLRLLIAAALLLLAAPLTAHAEGLQQRELRIPMAEAGSAGLEALLVWPDEPGRHPLALISHGSPRSSSERPQMTPLAMLPQARELARRGWAAAVVMRRGYGGSGGSWQEGHGRCSHANYEEGAGAMVADLKAAIAYLATLPEVDASRMIALGVSVGGFATVALTADPPPGLVAAISFAGGRGSPSSDTVCSPDALVAAFRNFGSRSRVPMLWIYAENDHFFGPSIAHRLLDAFKEGGGQVTFIAPPPFGDDGHKLFSSAGIPIWTPLVDEFLKSRGLVLRATPLALTAAPALAPPAQLSADGRSAFASYLTGAPHKAFAVSPNGDYGWRSGRRSTEEAKSGALENCAKHGKDCRVIMVDDTAAN